jgi:hypothetical protein
MADICLANRISLDKNRISLDKDMLAGNPSPRSSVSHWIHINQGQPDASSWRLWRKACSHWSYQNQLHFRLGPWIKPGHLLCRIWPYYYDYQDGDFYVHQDKGYTRCVIIDPIRFHPVLHIDWHLMASSIPVHARLDIHDTNWIPSIRPTPPVPTPVPNIPATFTEYLSSLALHMGDHVDCYEFIQLIESQPARNTEIQLLTMSDGSDNFGAMTFGWTIALPDSTCLARGSSPAYGPFGTSFRAKGYGFLSVVSWILFRLQEFCGITSLWQMKMMTDNLGLLTRVQKVLPYPYPFLNTILSKPTGM